MNSDSSDTPPRYTSAKLHSVADKLRETPKLSIDRLPVLHSLFERVAHASIEAFRDYCAMPVTAFVNQLEIKESWDLLEDYEDSVAVIFYSAEWDARILIGIERRLIVSLLEAMYGGDGAEAPYSNVRPFTLLEARAARMICEMAARALEAAFAPVSEISLVPEKTETTLAFTTLGQTSIMMVNAQLLFQVLDQGGRMFIFIPQAALYPLRQRLEKERSATPSAPDPWWAKKMQSGLAGADVILQVTLDGRELELIDLAGLREGQVLELHGTDKTVGIECGGQALFKARLGQGGGFFNVTLDEAIRNHDEFLDDILLNAVLS